MDTREDTEVVDLQGDVTWTETLHSVIFGHLRVTFKKQSTLSDLYWTKRKKEKKSEIFSLLVELYLVVVEYCF